jgi:hypothetical protein
MPIAYALEPHLTAQEFQDVLVSSTLLTRPFEVSKRHT